MKTEVLPISSLIVFLKSLLFKKLLKISLCFDLFLFTLCGKNTKTQNLISSLLHSLLARFLLAFSTYKKKNAHGTADWPESSFSSQSFLPHSPLLLRSNIYSMFILGIVFSFTNLILGSLSDCLIVIFKGHSLFTGDWNFLFIVSNT